MDAIQKLKSLRTEKDEAINNIAIGAAIQFIPLIILGLIPARFPSFSVTFLSLISVGLFIPGWIAFVQGTLGYAQSKGHHSAWGWLGLLSLWGLAILLFFPDKRNFTKQQSSPGDQNPFIHLNLIELTLFPFMAAVALYMTGVCVIAGFSSFTIAQLLEIAEQFSYWPMEAVKFGCTALFCLYLIHQIWQSRLAPKAMLGRLQAIQLKQILLITIVDLLFALSAAWLTLCGISFFAPGYIAERLERQSLTTDVPTLALWSLSAVVIAPLLEEFIFRGIIIHKLELKWGLLPGILISSLLFALLHFRFDVVPLFVMGLLYAFLYLKSNSLWPSICCHAAYNFGIISVPLVSRLSSKTTFDNTDEMIQVYQQSVQSNPWVLVPILFASSFYLIHFMWTIRPKTNSQLPYFVNQSRLATESAAH